MAEAVERGACGGQDHKAAAASTVCRIRESTSDALGRGRRERFRRADLDDLPAGAGAWRRMCARASTAALSSMPTASAKREIDEDTGEEPSAKFPSSKATPSLTSSRSTDCPRSFYAKAEPRLDPVQRIEQAEAFFAATGAAIRHGGNQAYYSVTDDRVQMPPVRDFPRR